MPQYFFDVHDARGLHRDEFGDEFASPVEAMNQAQAVLGSILREEIPDGEDHKVACEIRNEAGATVYRGELTYQGVRF